MKLSRTTIRWSSAILLLVCFVLPLTQCTQKSDVDVSNGKIQLKDAPVERTTIYHAYDYIEKEEPLTLLIFLSFAWPVILLLIRKFIKKQNASLLFVILEILFCAGSVFIFYNLSHMGEALFGIYLTFFALIIYFCTTVMDVRVLIKSRGKKF